jgi:hypothetical protein
LKHVVVGYYIYRTLGGAVLNGDYDDNTCETGWMEIPDGYEIKFDLSWHDEQALATFDWFHNMRWKSNGHSDGIERSNNLYSLASCGKSLLVRKHCHGSVCPYQFVHCSDPSPTDLWLAATPGTNVQQSNTFRVAGLAAILSTAAVAFQRSRKEPKAPQESETPLLLGSSMA